MLAMVIVVDHSSFDPRVSAIFATADVIDDIDDVKASKVAES